MGGGAGGVEERGEESSGWVQSGVCVRTASTCLLCSSAPTPAADGVSGWREERELRMERGGPTRGVCLSGEDSEGCVEER